MLDICKDFKVTVTWMLKQGNAEQGGALQTKHVMK